jgi:hypothetical protein
MEIARPHIAKWASWYDVDSFAWKSRDKIKLLGSQALGEAIGLTERLWFQCKPRRGGAGIVPIDKGTDKQVREWIEAARHKSAEKRNLKLQRKRQAVRDSLETEVRQLLKEGLSYHDIAERFQAEHLEHPSAKGIHIWTERQVFAFDPDRKNPEHKRKFEAERKRMKRQAMTPRERKEAQIEEARRMIYAMHSEGVGYASIARILNEQKIPPRSIRAGAKWHKSSVKRELDDTLGHFCYICRRVHGGHGGTQKCPLSPSDYTRGNMTGERGSKLSQAATAETQQEENIWAKGKVAKDQSLPRLAWSNPVLIEMAYTEPLRQLYREKVAEAA